MRLFSQAGERSTARKLQDRMVWQSASLLLAYPDDQHAERLDTVERLLAAAD